MPDPVTATHHGRSSARVAGAASFLVLLAATASAQALIKVDDTTRFRLGVLLQPQADWTQDAGGGYAQNLFLRRARVLLDGQLSPKVTFFLETDNPNLGRAVGAAKSISRGFTLQDAFVVPRAGTDAVGRLPRHGFPGPGYLAHNRLEYRVSHRSVPRPRPPIRRPIGLCEGCTRSRDLASHLPRV